MSASGAKQTSTGRQDLSDRSKVTTADIGGALIIEKRADDYVCFFGVFCDNPHIGQPEGCSEMKRHVLFATAIAAMILIVANVQVHAVEVRLLGAVGVRQIMLDLGPQFERASGHKLVSEFDSTGVIVRRVTAGENFDLIMINRTGIDSLAKSGKVIAGSTVDVARSVAAAAVRKGAPKPDISTVEAFKRALLAAKSIARPSPAVGGSSGDHIVKVLERLRIADEVNAKSIINQHPEDMSNTPGYMVADGRADLALHQLQELMAVPGIEIIGPFPGDLQGTFMFSVALTTSTKQQQAAKKLIEFLGTPEAMAAIRAKGMEPAVR
jgi:molybdate transport system substrate-binding protein